MSGLQSTKNVIIAIVCFKACLKLQLEVLKVNVFVAEVQEYSFMRNLFTQITYSIIFDFLLKIYF